MLSKFAKYTGVVMLSAVALSACAPQRPAPTTVQLGINGAANMNGGAPAQVKVYYLNDAAAFRSADFFAVFGEPEATLGDDLVAVDTYQLAPGRRVTDTKSLTTPASAVGVVAAFRDVNGRFLTVKRLAPNTLNPVQVTLSGNTVTVQ